MSNREICPTLVAEITRIRQLLERLVPEPEKITEESARPWLTTVEAAAYLRMESTGLRTLISRGRITPDGRGSRRGHMFRRETLDAYLTRSVADEATAAPRDATAPKAVSPKSIERPRGKPTRALRDLVQAAEDPRTPIPTELLSSTRNAMGRGRTP